MGMIERFNEYTVALERAYQEDDWSLLALAVVLRVRRAANARHSRCAG